MKNIISDVPLMAIDDGLSSINEAHKLLNLAPVAMDFVSTLLGQKIGAGVFRSVYHYPLDERYVIKVEPLNTNCNVVEYMMWNEIRNLMGDKAWVKDWFAPVKWISPNGRLLLMQKTVEKDRKKPDKIPKFMWDVKTDNFGWIGNKYVCHDYGQFYNFINYPSGMVKVKW